MMKLIKFAFAQVVEIEKVLIDFELKKKKSDYKINYAPNLIPECVLSITFVPGTN